MIGDPARSDHLKHSLQLTLTCISCEIRFRHKDSRSFQGAREGAKLKTY